MNGTFHQDFIYKWYIPVLSLVFLIVFGSYFALFKVNALIALMWLPALSTIGFLDSSEKVTHFGSYAVCSHAVSRKQYLTSKYTAAAISLTLSVVYMLAICILADFGPAISTPLSNLLMTSMMCLLGICVQIMIMVRIDTGSHSMMELITILIAAINVVLLLLWPQEMALMVAVSVIAVICAIVCCKKSFGYVKRTNL